MYIKSYRVRLRRCLHFRKIYFINSLLEAKQQYKRQIRMPFHHTLMKFIRISFTFLMYAFYELSMIKITLCHSNNNNNNDIVVSSLLLSPFVYFLFQPQPALCTCILKVKLFPYSTFVLVQKREICS